MADKNVVQEILDGADVRKVLNKPGLTEAQAYDASWLEDVHKAAANVFGADKKLWDLMAFAPDKYFRDDLQDALNAFSKWYQNFLRVKKEEANE